MTESFEELSAEVMSNQDGRCAVIENRMRRKMAKTFESYRDAYGFSVRKLSELAGIPQSQARRLLHQEVGGLLPLRAIVRAADVFGLDVEITLTRRVRKP